jgi:hypothetical protein
MPQKRSTPFVDPLHPPIVMPGQYAPASGKSDWTQPPYARAPLSSIVTWTPRVGGVGQGTTVLTIDQPSMLKLLRIEPDLADNDHAFADVFWRPFGEGGNPVNLYANLNSFRRQPFIGPYAWFPRAGQYEICAAFATDGAIVDQLVRAELQRGVSVELFNATVRSDGGHTVRNENEAIALAEELPALGDMHSSFFLYRRIKIQNTGAGQIDVTVGIDSSFGSRFELAAGATLDLAPEQLGRDTVSITGVAASSFSATGALW